MSAIRFVAALAGLTMIVACSGAMASDRGSTRLDDVIARLTDATGGKEAIESVRSIEVKARLSESGSEFEVLFRAMRPGLCRVDVSVEGEVVYREAYDGEKAREQAGPGEPIRPSGGKGTAALRRSAVKWLYGLHELPALGYSLELLEPTGIDGVMHPTVRLTHPDGKAELLFFDPASFRLVRGRAVSALHAEVDPEERKMEGRNSEFREIDGILRPMLSETVDRDTGEVLKIERTESVRINLDLDAKIFALADVD